MQIIDCSSSPMAGGRTTVRVAVVSDRGTGKSSLIAAAASENFPESVPSVLPPPRLPSDFYPDGIPVPIIDPSSSFDQETQALKPRCVRALKRIFILCAHDLDGALNDMELNEFQVKCLPIIAHSEKKLIWAVALAITSVLAYVAMFSIGMGPLTWVYSSEIFPLRLRAQGTSLGVAANCVMRGIISMTFLSLSTQAPLPS